MGRAQIIVCVLMLNNGDYLRNEHGNKYNIDNGMD